MRPPSHGSVINAYREKASHNRSGSFDNSNVLTELLSPAARTIRFDPNSLATDWSVWTWWITKKLDAHTTHLWIRVPELESGSGERAGTHGVVV
jgi:hypothetical protein